jgi:hypothetical protein
MRLTGNPQQPVYRPLPSRWKPATVAPVQQQQPERKANEGQRPRKPRRSLARNAAAGSANYATGVQNNQDWQVAHGSRKGHMGTRRAGCCEQRPIPKGVSKAGQAKWQSASVQKGQPRFQQACQRHRRSRTGKPGSSRTLRHLGTRRSRLRAFVAAPATTRSVQTIGDTLHKIKVGS